MNPALSIVLVDVLDDRNRDDRENLGLASIAAFLRSHGLSVELHSLLVSERLAPAIGQHHEVLAFSAYPNTIRAVFQIAAELKDAHPDVLVGLGGRLATDAVAEILADCRAVDFCVLGDGELPMLRVAQARLAGDRIDGIPHVSTRVTSAGGAVSEVDVEKIPWPARDYLDASLAHGNPTVRLNSSWGCLASCSFCSVNSFFAREVEERRRTRNAPNIAPLQLQRRPTVREKWRARTPDDVYREIVALETERRARSFVFNDPSFEDPGRIGKERLRELCERLMAHPARLAFRCSMRAESFKAEDADLLALMRNAGFTHVFIGIEAGNPGDLTNYRKIAKVRDNSAALELFACADIDTTMGFIMLNPYSTSATAKANYEFLVHHRAAKVDHYTRKVDVYYRTSLHERLAKDGLLLPDFSYDTPLAYCIRDLETAALDRALDPVRDDPVCGQFDARMYHVSYSLSTLRALDPGAAARPQARFEQVVAATADRLAQFFEPPFVRGDHRAIERDLPRLHADLDRLSCDLRAIGAQLAMAVPLRQLLVRGVPSQERREVIDGW